MLTNIGPHKVTCAGVEDALVDEMLKGERIRVLYSDPPWGDGNLKWWVKYNERTTGKVFAPLTYDQLLDRLFELVHRYVDGYVFIETGLRWETELTERFKAELTRVRVFRLSYKAGGKMLPNILVGGTTSSRHTITCDPSGKTGLTVPREVVWSTRVPGGLVLDPCCGMGYTARAAVAAGMAFRGNEFNEKRLAKTIDFLRTSVPR